MLPPVRPSSPILTQQELSIPPQRRVPATAVSRDNSPGFIPTIQLPTRTAPCSRSLCSDMPTAARKRKRTRAADRPNNESSSEHIQTVNSSASQQHQQPAHQVSKSNNSNDLQDPSQGSGSPTDGARNPIAPGAEYTSLRKITRRLPDDPEHFLDGLDTTAADLSWTARDEGDGINPKTGQPWLYPKKRGRREGSNLEEFREEIEEMTKNGQGCKTISEVLVERGVDTSVRAVARQRMKWGLRQRVGHSSLNAEHLSSSRK